MLVKKNFIIIIIYTIYIIYTGHITWFTILYQRFYQKVTISFRRIA